MQRRIAIVNRGEAAMRLVHAVREFNAHGHEQLTTIALHTSAERNSRFAREADEAYDLGPAQARPYLDHAVLERALVATRADAAWVGWGFVAEDPAFAELCERLGVVFVGPSPAAMRALGDKIGAKLLAEKAGVPVAAWSDGPVDDVDAAVAHAARIGYPLMLKAAAGGGGRGIRVVTSDAELRAVFERTRDEARRAFGSDVVFLERLVTGARHVEVQLIGDAHGTVWALGVRDCSVQRRNQKVIEESASPVLTAEQETLLKDSAVRLLQSVGYCGAGTAEFLYQPGEGTFAFLEVNTRLQVEHPVTELVTGTDLVRLQLHVAAGGALEGAAPPVDGHAVEARLNAEDPDRDFAPAPGRIALLRLPEGPGVRVDTGVSEGDTIPADFDSMIAKIVATGATREQALARLRRAVAGTTVVIEGGTTNKTFVLDLLDAPEVVDGTADTGWIDRARTTGRLVNRRHAAVALVAAAVDAYETAEGHELTQFLTSAHGGRPQGRRDVGRTFGFRLHGAAHQVTVLQTGPQRYRAVVDGTPLEAQLLRLGPYMGRLTLAGSTHRVVLSAHGTDHIVDVDGAVHRVVQDEGGVVRSPAPALVVNLPVAPGQEVAAGQPVVVLESMKMETAVPAPVAGRVRDLLVAVNEQVSAGQPLLRLEPGRADDDQAPAADAPTLELPAAAVPEGPVEQALAHLGTLRGLFLGFDVPADDARAALSRYLGARDTLPDERGRLFRAELDVLTAFSDVCEISRNRPHGRDRAADAPEPTDTSVHSPREYFHRYLHSLDVDREHLPESFRVRLAQLLAHYGVDGVERTADLESAVSRVFSSLERMASHVPVVSALLERWLGGPAPRGSQAQTAYEVLDHLVTATQLRFPAVGDLARSIRFRWFEAPVVEAAREAAFSEVRNQLRYLSAHPEAPDLQQRIERLVASPEPVVRFLCERITDGVPEREPMLEVLARRLYGAHGLADLVNTTVERRPVVTARYVLDDRPTFLVSTVATMADVAQAIRLLQVQVASAPEGHEVAVDLYLAWPQAPVQAEAAVDHLLQRLAGHTLPAGVRRVALAVAGGEGDFVHQLTLRPGPGGHVVEDDLVRGLHPMVARRLDLWRLRDFRISRLPSSPDVLLYRCVAPENESDVRLVAMGQVRELSFVRDAEGRLATVPQFERAVSACLDAIRQARRTLPGGARLDMNHVWLYTWPVIEAPLDELTGLRRSLAPLTTRAGVTEVVAQGQVKDGTGAVQQVSVRFAHQPGQGVVASVGRPPRERLAPLDDYAQKVIRSQRRGTIYPYELVSVLTQGGGSFVEHDLDADLQLVPVERAPGGNRAGLVVGTVTGATPQHPGGITRVALFGDPTKALGAVSEGECRRIIAGLDLAARLGVPVEWYALSSGARISMTSGVENMDWVARALRRIVEFTQAGGEVNVVVTGINVGAQPYWNAEATMLMHTKGILVMTPDSAMVLTGKQSLDYSGGVSAEDNFGIGGYDRVMGPNGQAQYWAPDLAGAIRLLFAHYDYSYVVPGEAGPRRAVTADPVDRDITSTPHRVPDSEFTTVGQIFDRATNPERKKPFDMRTLMRAVVDADHPPLERWAGMADAETSVVFDAHLAGHPVTVVGIESRPVARRGFPPTDGPDTWTAGTLFPRSSKKTARAINAASGSRPVVVLANLSGFDGSPESLRMLQLEYGAEIGRALVNFDGPIVFCVVSRYHGGAFVVFSKSLADNMQVLAVEGAYASVLGGAPAAAVVFSAEVDQRTGADPRVRSLEKQLEGADDVTRARVRTELAELRAAVRSEKLGEVATEFDGIHSIERAVQVGSVDRVVPAARLRPELVEAVERGLRAAGRLP